MAELEEAIPTTPSRRLIPLFLSGAILFVICNIWIALKSVQNLEESHRWVDHTWEVIAQVERVISTAKDAETGSRGYLLTGDEKFLEPYLNAKTELPLSLSAFKQLTSDNQSQQVRAEEMREVMDHRLSLSEQINALRSPNAPVAINRMTANLNAGKADMDQMRTIANQMENEERRLLGDRIQTARTAVLRVRFTLAAASILDVIMIVLTFRYFARERGLRLSAEETAQRLALSRREVERKAEEIQELNQNLELRVKQRTSELETLSDLTFLQTTSRMNVAKFRDFFGSLYRAPDSSGCFSKTSR
jgi:CHASE3 domain sensor protein